MSRHMMAGIITQPHITRPATTTTIIRRIITGLLVQPYAPAFAITTLTVRATTAVQSTATGIDLRRALGQTHRRRSLLADAPMPSSTYNGLNFHARCSQGVFCSPPPEGGLQRINSSDILAAKFILI